MQKKVLTEQSIIFGDVSMPKGFEIDSNVLSKNILEENFIDNKFKFSRTWDKLNAYITEHVYLKYKIILVNKENFGNIYKSGQMTEPLLNVDPIDLKNSADYTMLYGIQVKNCFVRIYYDDNRKKGKSWDIELKNNMFVLFPSTNMYAISNNQQDSLNFIQTITYESR